MMTKFRLLPGLPAYGEPATGFPADWATRGHEGLVVEFTNDGGETWVGNFQPGLGGLDSVLRHPNERDFLVMAKGTLWNVDSLSRTAVELAPTIFQAWPVSEPDGFIFNRQDLAFLRYAKSGLLWHTRRISWDGFKDLNLDALNISGKAWSPIDNKWIPFQVDTRTGRAEGGSMSGPGTGDWEQLSK